MTSQDKHEIAMALTDQIEGCDAETGEVFPIIETLVELVAEQRDHGDMHEEWRADTDHMRSMCPVCKTNDKVDSFIKEVRSWTE